MNIQHRGGEGRGRDLRKHLGKRVWRDEDVTVLEKSGEPIVYKEITPDTGNK